MVLVKRQTHFLGVATVIPVNQKSRREAGDHAANTCRQGHERDLHVGEAIQGVESGREVSENSVVAGVCCSPRSVRVQPLYGVMVAGQSFTKAE